MIKNTDINVSPRFFVSLLVAATLIFTVLSSVVMVKYGTVGAVTRFNAVTGKIMQPGLNFKIPFIESVIRYNTQKITYEASDQQANSQAEYTDFPADSTTRDGQSVIINYTVRFRVDGSLASWVAQNLGPEQRLVENIVKVETRSFVRNIAREYPALDLYSGNVFDYQERVRASLDTKFTDNGLVLDDFRVRSILFSKDYIATIEGKQIEKEKIQTEQFKAQQAKFTADAAIREAEGQKQAKILNAEGDAQAVLVRADAEAKAINLKGQQLSKYPQVIQFEFVQNISDNVSVLMMDPNNALPLLNLNELIRK